MDLTSDSDLDAYDRADHRISVSSTPDQDLLDQWLIGYDYDLPAERIAQTPAVPRDSARLLVADSVGYQHRIFQDLPNLLQPGDLLILNNTRVIPARLFGRKVASSHSLNVEVLLLEARQNSCWLALVKPGKRLKPGTLIEFGYPDQPSLSAVVLEIDPATRGRILKFNLPQEACLEEKLNQLGQIPLPPYIKDSTTHPEQYQTIYAERPGAVAAPTAGLHFTSELLKQLQLQEIHHNFVTLHVGVGTFRPVEVEEIKTHKMHEEWVEISETTVQAIHQTQARGGRVIAVGTTVVRALEGASQQGELQPFQGKMNLFIYPGYKWRVVEGLITNFHLPRSSLLMLVSALLGRERLLELYQVAIAQQYRFYSFGDAMLILPEAKLG